MSETSVRANRWYSNEKKREVGGWMAIRVCLCLWNKEVRESDATNDPWRTLDKCSGRRGGPSLHRSTVVQEKFEEKG